MKRILIVEDDPLFSSLMADALKEHGFEVCCSHDHDSSHELIKSDLQLTHCLLDLGLPSGSGLGLIIPLKEKFPDLKIVVLTGFANVPTAVEAIKLGAIYYLSKPIEIEQVLEAFNRDGGDAATPLNSAYDLDSREREHVLAVLQKNHFNISVSAIDLGMHRRTLQRKIQKWGLKN